MIIQCTNTAILSQDKGKRQKGGTEINRNTHQEMKRNPLPPKNASKIIIIIKKAHPKN
jgi:hypothetical protein